MAEKCYYLKPAPENFPVPWNGGPEYPGPDNFGTADAPVFLSGGAINEWVYGPSTADIHDRSTQKHIFYLSTGTYAVGPAFDRSGNYVQGADSIYMQTNPARPNRKVQAVFQPTIPGTRPYMKLYGWNYTQEETAAWTGTREVTVFFVAGNRYLDRFEMYDLDVDMNWENQGYASFGDTRGFKGHCIQIRANNYTIKRCRFVNAGSNGAVVGGPNPLAMEAFPLNTYSLEAAKNSCLIEDCEVSDFHSAHGGYATMISVNPHTAIPEVRPVKFFNDMYHTVVPVVTVRNCKVHGINETNGLGAAGFEAYAADGCLFENNVVTDCGIGSNFDTSGIINVEMRGNTFTNCANVIQLGTPTGGLGADGKPDPNLPPFMYNFYIHDNTIQIRRNDLQLSATERVRGCFMLLRNNAAGLVVMNNQVWADHWSTYANWLGSTAADRYWRFLNKSGEDPYSVPGYYGSYGPGNPVIDDYSDGRFDGNVIAPAGMIDDDGYTIKRLVEEVAS